MRLIPNKTIINKIMISKIMQLSQNLKKYANIMKEMNANFTSLANSYIHCKQNQQIIVKIIQEYNNP